MPGNLAWSRFAYAWRFYWDGDTHIAYMGMLTSSILAMVALLRPTMRLLGYAAYVIAVAAASALCITVHSYLRLSLPGAWGSMFRIGDSTVFASDLIMVQPAFWLLVVRMLIPKRRMIGE